MLKKIKFNYLFILIIISILGSITTIFLIEKLNDKLINLQANSNKIDKFISGHQTNLNHNEDGLAALEEQEDIVLEAKYRYQSDDGITMTSYSDIWNTEKLKQLYEELRLNKHGEEFTLLNEVIVYGEADSYAAGVQSNNLKKVKLNLKWPALADNSEIPFFIYMGTIRLYNGDYYTTVADMAHVLSHEYGHHFTFYHFFNGDDVDNSEYESIRNFDSEVFYNWSHATHYYANHHWYLIEIAADDYVQLMGSPMTRSVSSYTDIQQNIYNEQKNVRWWSYNGTIQGNLLLPFADEVDGLKAYFYSFIDEELSEGTIYEKKSFKPRITKGYSHHDSISGALDFIHYVISWDDIYQDAIYTLVCCDEDGSNMTPIKTVYPNQSNKAYIGTVSYETYDMIYWRYDNLDKGIKKFIVTALLPDDTLYKSEVLTYEFK
ncbi:MAG: hypothetical protein PHG99_07525 [Erysipelotrichaceae bacterium]|nr:hypothetical protein [Erysipelotrichaceae bacterium]MDD4643328.1 hypothetical protein [Erysipelotrichaceae bacterium]